MRELIQKELNYVSGGEDIFEPGNAGYGYHPGSESYPITDARNPMNPGHADWGIGRRFNEWLDSIFGG